mgnify:CR=1 FL=1
MKSLVAIDSKPCRNESIFRDVIALNQIPPNPQELQLSPKLLILINSYSWCQKAMVSSTPDNGNEGNGEGGNEGGDEAPDPAA